jgi:phosphate transport system substrate-binding protein
MISAKTLAPFVGALALALTACGPSEKTASSNEPAIVGAGATFPAPIYAKWAEDYAAAGQGSLNYQAVGSGAGVAQIKTKTINFGGTDKPLKAEALEADGLYQFPAVMGGVVPIYNIPGIESGKLKLTGAVLADIYLGKIKNWNAPAIAALNPDLKLPNLPITVAYRADGSGTTFLFTSYLAEMSPGFQTGVGASDTVAWPVGAGGKGNDGVAGLVKNSVGGIGYVEYAYAKQTAIAAASMQNKDGQFIAPSAEAFAAAAAGADWSSAPGNYLLLLNQPGAQSWPITGATFIVLHKTQENAAEGAAVLKFFDWVFTNGDASAKALDYVPMPESVKTLVRSQWADIKGPDGQPVYTPAAP